MHDLFQLANAAPPFDPSALPEQVVLSADRLHLRVTWPDGEKADLTSDRLRASCRCAWCTRARIDDKFPASFDGVTIDGLAPVGDYALNIAFTDGHGRGIYPFTYLRKLAQDASHHGTPA